MTTNEKDLNIFKKSCVLFGAGLFKSKKLKKWSNQYEIQTLKNLKNKVKPNNQLTKLGLTAIKKIK